MKAHIRRSIALAALAVFALALSTPARSAPAKAGGAGQLRAEMRKLWEDHITWTRLYIVSVAAGLPDKDATAQRLLQNQVDIGTAIKPFYGDDIAAFLAGANPKNWPLADMKSSMKMHLDLTLKEALDRFGGKYADDVRDYDAVHAHILGLADTLTNGIAAQFPDKVKG